MAYSKKELAEEIEEAYSNNGEEGEEGGADFGDEIEMFGEKEVRWYQIAARNAVIEALKQKAKRILVVMPTGVGKTLTSGMIFSDDEIRKLLGVKGKRKLRLLFIAHRNRLLTQAERVYADAQNVEMIVQSAFSPIPQELLKNPPDIVCLDEAHHEAMMSIQLQLEHIGDWVIIGLTATPDRADGDLIKFEEIINPMSREQAVTEGWLAPTKLFSFVDAPTKDKTKILKDVFDSYAKQMGQTMVFVRTKAEVAVINAYLQSLKYKSIALLNQTDRELDQVLDRFSDKKFQFVVNCLKINEGVDVRYCESVVLGRQFGSYPQLNQVIGRASRPDSDCRVWELINPLSGRNLDTTVVVGTPELHKLVYRVNGKWVEREFDYTSSSRRLDTAFKDDAQIQRYGQVSSTMRGAIRTPA